MFSEVIELIRKEEVSLFIGAGFSLKAGAPSAWNLTCAIRAAAVAMSNSESAKKRLGEAVDLPSISQELVEICNGDRTRLNHILEEQFKFHRGDLSDQELLSHIPNIRHIFTTNYDSLIEGCYGDKAQVIRCDDDVASLNSKKVNIFKIHGDLTAKDNIIITKHDYTEFFSQQKNKGLWNLVQTEFLSQNILFIGYSLEDENILTLIEKVREYAPNSAKKIYLLALNLEDYKQKKLERYGITYYNAKAEQFLEELHTELCDKMTHDFENGDVSFDAYSKFLNERGLQVEVRSENNKNQVRDVSFIGNRREASINFKTSKEVYDKILNLEFSPIQLGKTVTGLGEVPRNMVGIELASNDIRNFDYRMNGISIKDGHDMKNLFIIPTMKKKRVRIHVLDGSFTRKVNFWIFQTSQTSYRYSLSNALYQMDLTIGLNPVKKTLDCQLSIDENEHIGNLYEAKTWCNLLIALWSGKTISFKGIFHQDVQFDNPDRGILKRFRMLEKYLDNLIYLENSDNNIEFNRYDRMNQILFNTSEMLYFYFSKEIKVVEFDSDFDLSCEIANPSHSLPKIGEDYAFTFKEKDRRIDDFNGFSITIPYLYEIYPNCRVGDIITTSEDSITLKLKSNMKIKYYQFTDVPVVLRSEEGPIEEIEL